MFDAVLSLCERIVYQHCYAGDVPGPEGNRHPLLCPFGLFPTSDGWATIGAPAPVFWRDLCRAMDRPDLIDHPDWATNAARLARRDAVYDLVGAFTRRHTKAELMKLIGGKVPFGPVYDVRDIFADPHFAAREMLVEIEHPGSAIRPKIAGVPVKMSRTPGAVRRRAPLLGEDTDAVLSAAGYSSAEIAAMREAGAIK